MVRRFIVAAATLSLIACASSSENTSGASDDLNAAASTVPVRVLRQTGTRAMMHTETALANVVRNTIDLTAYREARIEDVTSADGTEHLVVQLLVTGQHSVKLTRIDVDTSLNVQKVTSSYHRAAEDELTAAAAAAPSYTCPDPTVQFIALCPNNDTLEIATTNDVASAAIAAGLKTVTLLKSEATHDAYMNYMKCPKLVGNFYDGDSNPDEMVTYDGAITATEIAASEQFNLAATTIWVACEAYNDPMLSAVQKTAKAQKYAAGINDLAVGPSDNAAACAMKAAIAGKPETAAFNDCYNRVDDPSDKWGFDGSGADVFATLPPASRSGN